MRISDWSSDVCSSDLETSPATPFAPYGEVRAEGAARIVRPAPHGRGNQLIIDRRRLPDKIAHIAHDFGDARRRMRDRQCWRRQQFMVLTAHVVSVSQNRRTGKARDCNLHVATRSEEHTSELQSLMRISYAVFCL